MNKLLEKITDLIVGIAVISIFFGVIGLLFSLIIPFHTVMVGVGILFIFSITCIFIGLTVELLS
jgi:hypothetical protein